MTWLLYGIIAAIPLNAYARDAAAFYRQNCAACHSIGGGRRLGPDLQNVLQRADRKWLLDFLENPKAALDSGGEYGKKILAEAHGMIMPPVTGLDRPKAEALLDWIGAQSERVPSAVAAEPAFTPADVIRGRELVVGSRRLAKGGASCISCHSFRGLPGLGGGSLGPDLTHEYTRLGGRAGVSGWLTAPATATMQSVYKAKPLRPDEIRGLAAYLESISEPKQGSATGQVLLFFVLGVGGCLLGLVVMNASWNKRFRAVRRPLVAGKRGQQ